jgi:hypothetical protein
LLAKAARDSGHPIIGDAPEVLVICPPPLANLSQSPFKDILMVRKKSRASYRLC